MKTSLAAIALFLLTACGSSPANSSAQLDAGRDPACTECAPDCCSGEAKAQAAVEVAPKGGCCSEGEAKANAAGSCCSEGSAKAEAKSECCAGAAATAPKTSN